MSHPSEVLMNETARPKKDSVNMVAFSPPFEQDGVTVITATSTRPSRRPITGTSPPDQSASPGAHPMGAFVIQGGSARWHPAVDVTRLVTTAEIVAGAVLVARVLAR